MHLFHFPGETVKFEKKYKSGDADDVVMGKSLKGQKSVEIGGYLFIGACVERFSCGIKIMK